MRAQWGYLAATYVNYPMNTRRFPLPCSAESSSRNFNSSTNGGASFPPYFKLQIGSRRRDVFCGMKWRQTKREGSYISKNVGKII